MLEKIVTWLVFHWPAVIKEREVGKQVKALLVMDGIHHADYIVGKLKLYLGCLLYTSDAADEEDSVDLGGRRIIKKKKQRWTEVDL